MFNNIAQRYDLLNRMLSLGIDHYWRKQLSKALPARQQLDILDIATGTGDVMLSLEKHASRQIQSLLGMDLAEDMMAKGRVKVEKRGLSHKIRFKTGDGTQLPSQSGQFDAVSIAFGIRNLPSLEAGLQEMYRVLKPKGKVLVLEFSLPKNSLIRWLYLVYFRFVLPKVGALISGDAKAYHYLNESVEAFPSTQAFLAKMKVSGFSNCMAHPLTFGIATLYEGEKK